MHAAASSALCRGSFTERENRAFKAKRGGCCEWDCSGRCMDTVMEIVLAVEVPSGREVVRFSDWRGNRWARMETE